MTFVRERVFSLQRHAMPCHRWRCLFWLSSSESKSPRGTKPEAYPLCMWNKGESTLWVQWRARASWTLTCLLSSRENTHIHILRNGTETPKNLLFCFSIFICLTWRNGNFHYLIDPIISHTERYCRVISLFTNNALLLPFYKTIWQIQILKSDSNCAAVQVDFKDCIVEWSLYEHCMKNGIAA